MNIEVDGPLKGDAGTDISPYPHFYGRYGRLATSSTAARTAVAAAGKDSAG